MKFWHIVRVVRQRLLMILGLVAVTLIVVAVAVPEPKVVYPASSYVKPTDQVMRGGASSTAEGVQGVERNREVILSNLLILAEGPEVLVRALDFLALSEDEQKKQCPGLPRYKSITRIELSPGTLLKPQNMRDWRDTLEVRPVQRGEVGEKGTTTDIISLTVRLPDGDMSPYIANAVAHAFREVYQEKSRENKRKEAEFLESSLEETRDKLRALQEQITDYKSSRDVVQVDAETAAAITSMTGLEASRSSAEAAVREATAAVRDIDNQLKREPAVLTEHVPADMNPEVQKLKIELAQAEAELRVMSHRYTREHDAYKSQVSRISSLKMRISAASTDYTESRVNDVHRSLVAKRSEAAYELARSRARLSAINASLAEVQGKANSLSRAEPKLAELMLERGQTEKRYQLLSDRLAQSLIDENAFSKTGSISPYIWAQGSMHKEVQGPTRRVLLVYGLILSLIVGIAVSIWLDSIDTRMRNAADVEKMLELPALGLTPALTGRDGVLPKLTHLYPLSAMAESYRILRTNVLFALRDNPFKTLMVATGRPGQGGTTTICNLAIALAQIGKRIILIDADMRRPSLHKFFGVSNETGLSTLLQGGCKLTDAFRKTDIENLVVIPGGPQPMNPSELLGSDKMRELVEMLEEHCDLVLFDTPSTVVFSDGPMLASWIDAVIMVVSANQAPRGTETLTRDLLRRAKANILGVVVNRMQAEAVDSCYYYSHYYADSVPQQPSDAIGSGTGGNGKREHGPDIRKSAPKAIPAPAVVSEDQDDNPFPE